MPKHAGYSMLKMTEVEMACGTVRIFPANAALPSLKLLATRHRESSCPNQLPVYCSKLAIRSRKS